MCGKAGSSLEVFIPEESPKSGHSESRERVGLQNFQDPQLATWWHWAWSVCLCHLPLLWTTGLQIQWLISKIPFADNLKLSPHRAMYWVLWKPGSLSWFHNLGCNWWLLMRLFNSGPVSVSNKRVLIKHAIKKQLTKDFKTYFYLLLSWNLIHVNPHGVKNQPQFNFKPSPTSSYTIYVPCFYFYSRIMTMMNDFTRK